MDEKVAILKILIVMRSVHVREADTYVKYKVDNIYVKVCN